MIIYKAKNKTNNKVYIGQTIHSLQSRKLQHLNRSKYDKYLTYFGKGIRKYGIEGFTWEIIDFAYTQEELNQKETYWIEYYKTTHSKYGYNLKGGGEKPYLTKKVKEKISKAQLGSLNHRYGKKGKDNPTSIPVINLTKNVRYESASICAEQENISASKVCAVCRGDRATTNGCVYRYLDDKEQIIEPNVKMERKSIPIINLDTKELFASIKQAQKLYDPQSTDSLSQALKRGKGSCIWKGYKWKYESLDISSELVKKKIRSDAKQIININTGEIYESIYSVGKNYRNLATALRKGNGECIYKKEFWKIIN